MKRRNFVQTSLTLLAGTSLTLSASAQTSPSRKKAFKVKSLDTRYDEKIVFGSTPIDFKLLGNDTENRLSVFISSNNLKGFGPPLHYHHTFDEFFCVLDGDFKFQIDDEKIELHNGDSLFVPRKTRHAFDCLNEKAGTLLVAITPSQGMEKFFDEMGKILNEHGKRDMGALQALYKTYHSEIVGPPLR